MFWLRTELKPTMVEQTKLIPTRAELKPTRVEQITLKPTRVGQRKRKPTRGELRTAHLVVTRRLDSQGLGTALLAVSRELDSRGLGMALLAVTWELDSWGLGRLCIWAQGHGSGRHGIQAQGDGSGKLGILARDDVYRLGILARGEVHRLGILARGDGRGRLGICVAFPWSRHWKVLARNRHWRALSRSRHWRALSRSRHWRALSRSRHWRAWVNGGRRAWVRGGRRAWVSGLEWATNGGSGLRMMVELRRVWGWLWLGRWFGPLARRGVPQRGLGSEIEILPSILQLRNWIHLNTKLDKWMRSRENQKQEVHIESYRCPVLAESTHPKRRRASSAGEQAQGNPPHTVPASAQPAANPTACPQPLTSFYMVLSSVTT